MAQKDFNRRGRSGRKVKRIGQSFGQISSNDKKLSAFVIEGE